MAGKSLKTIKELIVNNYRKDFPGETINSKVFSTYLLDRYAKLLYKLYKKSEAK